MINENLLVDKILKLLHKELPAKYEEKISEFEELVKKDLMRASYDLLDQLCRADDWQPSCELRNLILQYQVVF